MNVKVHKGRGFSVQRPSHRRDSPKGLPGPLDISGRILVAVQTGVVFLTVGLGLFFVAARAAGDEHEVLTVISAIVLSLGVGLMLSSAASFWVARTLGMFEAHGSE